MRLFFIKNLFLEQHPWLKSWVLHQDKNRKNNPIPLNLIVQKNI